MNKQEIKEYLKENLSLETKVISSCYGSEPYVEVKLMLDDEEISSCYINGSDLGVES